MNADDLIYICRTIGDLTGVPVRLYENNRLTLFHSVVQLSKDPLSLYEREIRSASKHISYYITPDFSYYGILNAEAFQIVIGPTRQVGMDPHEARRLAFQLDVGSEDANDFISSVQSIVCFPLDSLMQTLCSVNFTLNHEKLSLLDIVIQDPDQEELRRKLQNQDVPGELPVSPSETYRKASEPTEYTHNSLNVEAQLMDIIQSGDTQALKQWAENAPAVRPGILSSSPLRQYKNIFIVSAALSSRAAIRGGLSENTAFQLSDAYIQKCELLSDSALITNLQYHMIQDYTERVGKIRIGAHPSALVLQTANYVSQHIYERIVIGDIAAALYISPSRLSAKFKEDTGMTVGDYILKEKTEEAKRLLRYTDKSFSAISALLAFSSQSHFSRVFRHYSGMTPGEYRKSPDPQG